MVKANEIDKKWSYIIVTIIRLNFQYGELILNNLLSVIGGTGCGLETYLTLSFFLPLYVVEY